MVRSWGEVECSMPCWGVLTWTSSPYSPDITATKHKFQDISWGGKFQKPWRGFWSDWSHPADWFDGEEWHEGSVQNSTSTNPTYMYVLGKDYYVSTLGQSCWGMQMVRSWGEVHNPRPGFWAHTCMYWGKTTMNWHWGNHAEECKWWDPGVKLSAQCPAGGFWRGLHPHIHLISQQQNISSKIITLGQGSEHIHVCTGERLLWINTGAIIPPKALVLWLHIGKVKHKRPINVHGYHRWTNSVSSISHQKHFCYGCI